MGSGTHVHKINNYFVSSLQRAIQVRQMRRQIADQQHALERHAHQLEQTVTERTQELAEANAALRQSRDAFCLLIEAMPQLVWTARPDGAWEYANQRWYEYTGHSATLPLGDWIASYHPDDQSRVVTLWQTSLLTNQPFQVEARLCESKTGEYRWFLIRGVPLRNVYGRVWKWFGTCTDIHEKKVLEEALRESEVRFRQLVQSNLLGIAVADFAGTVQEANDAFLDLVDYTQEDVAAGRVGWATITPSDDQEREAQAIEEMRTTGMIQPFEKVYVAKNGRRVPVLVGATRFHPPGTSPSVLCFILDISARKAAEEQREAAHKEVTAILESITDAFSHVNRQWRYTYVNRRAEEYAGESRDEMVGQRIWDVSPELLGTSIERQAREAMATQEERHFEAWHPRWQRCLEISAYPAQDGLSLYFRDITERRQAEDALRESEARFRGLVDANIIGITVSDQTRTIREANEAFLDLIGAPREDLATGRLQWAALTAPEYQAQHVQTLEELLTTGKAQPFEKELVTKAGKRVPVLMGRTLFRKDGSEPWEISFILDLTARKEIERHKDLMLCMTSHELKTPLAALKGTLQLLGRRAKRAVRAEGHLSDPMHTFFDGLARSVEDSLRQIDVQTYLINDLLDASRITAGTLKLDLEPCDLVALVRHTVEDLRVTAPQRSLILEAPEHPEVTVLADRARISQVVTNYVTNALRYSPASQSVQIGLTIQEDAARVWVRDHGPGLREEEQASLWQCFSQIKGAAVQSGSGKGLGLGLYICRTLIEQHQGEVGVESTPGDGSTFWFTLPIVTRGDLLRSHQNHAERDL